MAFIFRTIALLICAWSLNVLEISCGVHRNHFLNYPLVGESHDALDLKLRKRSAENLTSFDHENIISCYKMIEEIFSLEAEGKYNETRPTLRFLDPFQLNRIDCDEQEYCWFNDKVDLYTCKTVRSERYNYYKSIIKYDPANKADHLQSYISKEVESCRCSYHATLVPSD